MGLILDEEIWVYAGQRETLDGKMRHQWYPRFIACSRGIMIENEETTPDGLLFGRGCGADVVGGIYEIQTERDENNVFTGAHFSRMEFTGETVSTNELYVDLRPAWVIKHQAAKSAQTRKTTEKKMAKIQGDLSEYTLGEIIQVGRGMNASQRRALMARLMQVVERGYEN